MLEDQVIHSSTESKHQLPTVILIQLTINNTTIKMAHDYVDTYVLKDEMLRKGKVVLKSQSPHRIAIFCGIQAKIRVSKLFGGSDSLDSLFKNREGRGRHLFSFNSHQMKCSGKLDFIKQREKQRKKKRIYQVSTFL